MSEPNTPWWLSWIVPLIAALGFVWMLVKKLFADVAREEMTEINRRLGKVELSLQRIEGRMQERWGDSRED